MSYQVANNCIIHSEECNAVLGPVSLECKSFHKSDGNFPFL